MFILLQGLSYCLTLVGGPGNKANSYKVDYWKFRILSTALVVCILGFARHDSPFNIPGQSCHSGQISLVGEHKDNLPQDCGNDARLLHLPFATVLIWCDMLILLTCYMWKFKVLSGFPPKQLICEDKSDSLSSLDIRSGDTLIIEEDKKAPRVPLDSYKKSLGSAALGKLTRK